MAVCLAVSGCGSPTSADDDDDDGPATVATYQGNWKGVVKRQSCTAAVGSCESAFQLAAFDLNLSVSNGQLSGTLKVGVIQLTVTGTLESDGALKLTGTGTNGIQSLTIEAWRTTVNGAAMSGTMTLRAQETSPPAFTRSAGLSLERVYKQGTSEASAALPLDLRFAIRVRDAYASQVDRGSGFPRTVEYGGCHYVDNAGPRVSLTFRVTPVGADGRDYDVQAQPFITTSSASNFLDCHVGAIDANVTRQIAPNARLRVEYSYDDGVGSAYEVTVPVR